MIVYRDRRERRRADDVARALRAADGMEALVLAGQVEAALADAGDPHVDAFRAVTRAAARAVLGRGDGALPIQPERWPAMLSLGTPEGYAWYALDPRAYAAAAEAWAPPGCPIVVVGIRGIGTSLAAIVHEALAPRDVRSFTVRPHGHPFDRRVTLDPGVSLAGARVLVVDEGPGLSGTSLAGTAAALSEAGVPDEHITLLPAHVPDPSALRTPWARERWARHEKLALPDWAPDDLRRGEDWSGGRWRGHRPVPVDPAAERRKRRLPEGVARWCGLPPFGDVVVERARALGEDGIGPRVIRHGGGALVLDWQEEVGPLEPEGLAEAVVRRLAHARRRPAASAPDADALREMVEVNLAEAGLDALVDLAGLADGPPVEVDGRLDLHEWVRTADGVRKLDGFDHGDDHFLPGPIDLAWDVAGVGVELGEALQDHVLARLADRDLRARVPATTVAYAAYRLGRAHLAASRADPTERPLWDREIERYRRVLSAR